MLEADTTGNGLFIQPEALGACHASGGGAGVVNHLPDHASGNLILEAVDAVHDCIGH